MKFARLAAALALPLLAACDAEEPPEARLRRELAGLAGALEGQVNPSPNLRPRPAPAPLRIERDPFRP